MPNGRHALENRKLEGMAARKAVEITSTTSLPPQLKGHGLHGHILSFDIHLFWHELARYSVGLKVFLFLLN